MIHKDLTFEILLRISNEKEKSLERNLTLQSVLFIISLIYISAGQVKLSDDEIGVSGILKPMFSDKSIFHIVMPMLLNFYFTKMGHNLYSYIYHRGLIYDFLDKSWETTNEEYKFTDIYSSYTRSSLFEAINLYINASDIKRKKLEGNNKLYILYSVVFIIFPGFNHSLTFFYLSRFIEVNLALGVVLLIVFLAMIFFCYAVFLQTYSQQRYPGVRRNFILMAIGATSISLILLLGIIKKS